jgi:hypothetical protein
MRERQDQQELGPVQSEDEQERHHHPGCGKRQDDAPHLRDAATHGSAQLRAFLVDCGYSSMDQMEGSASAQEPRGDMVD